MDKALAAKIATAAPPRVTVLMPVYNGGPFLLEALESILEQTFRDFELLVVDDGSTDRSADIVRSYPDPRIRLVQNGENLGLIATLNRGLDLARGEYLLRMDCDDISLPERLQRQVDFLDENPRVGVCGVWYREFGDRTRTTRCAVQPAVISCGTLFNPVVGHPSVLLRKSAFDANGLRYDPRYQHAEDYELWARALQYFDFANIPEVLLHYRVHQGQVTRSFAEKQMESAGKVRRLLLARLGIHPDDEEFEIHQMLSALTRPLRFSCEELPVPHQLEKIDRWLCRLKEANDRCGLYPEPAFSVMLVERWVGVCMVNFLAKGRWSVKLCAPPALFAAVPYGWRHAFAFVASRGRQQLGDLLLRRCAGAHSAPSAREEGSAP